MTPLELSWHFDARHHLYQWYGGVQIVSRHAVGQWFCVDLDSGRCLWERRLPRANTIRAIADGVIVASEMRSDGPWTADFGVYAIALETGDLLWTSHREGLAGTVCNLLDHAPGFTNAFRDRPKRVQDGEVLCESGRVLDLRSGRLLRRVPVEPTTSTDVAPPPPPPTGQLTVSGRTPEEPHRFVMSSARDGHEAWRFDIKETGHFILGSPRSWRADGERIYLVVSDGPTTVPIKAENRSIVRRVARRFHLWVLDATTGVVLERVPIGEAPLDECRIEDVNGRDLLVSAGNKRLNCYSVV